METVVPAIVGLLAFLCVAGLLQAEGGEGFARAARSKGVDEAMREAVRSMGSCLVRYGALSVSPLETASGELGARIDASPERGPAGVARRIRPAGTNGTMGLLALLSMGSSACCGIISLSVAGMLLGCAAPTGLLCALAARRRAMRERDLESAMPEAFGALAIALGSGHSLSQAMRFVGAHAAEPVRSEFMRVSFAIDCGVSATEALDAMLTRLPAPGLDLVALALKVSQRTGAPLKDLLGEAAQLVGTRIELKRQLDVKTSQARMSARLVAGMPVAMVCILTLLSPDFRRGIVLPAGAASVALALSLNTVAGVIIGRIMKVRL